MKIKIVKVVFTLYALLMPAIASGTSQTSIVAIREGVEQKPRWSAEYNYDGYKIEVDIPIIVPQTDKMPVISVKPWRPFDEEKWKETINYRCLVYAGICYLDMAYTESRCAACRTERNRCWVCSIQLLVSQINRGTYGTLYDYRLVGASTCICLYRVWRDWTLAVDKKKESFQGRYRSYLSWNLLCNCNLWILVF